jgi:farnesyl-diphosphate farnesyltransferase
MTVGTLLDMTRPMLGFRAVPDRSLDEILSSVSRSFYFSLAVLPRRLRSQLSGAYLVARAADTIADTRVVHQARRLELLHELRTAISQPSEIERTVADVRREMVDVGDAASPAERVLLERLGDCLRGLTEFESGDLERTKKVLGTLITGMERDLTRFPDESKLVALETMADLDEHCYMAAGCVGEYWTVMTAAHIPAVRRLQRPDFVARGVRLGKALQLVNVIRDAPADLRLGRCYIPRELLSQHELLPEQLRDSRLDPVAWRRTRALFAELRQRALAHVDAALPYVISIPRTEPRLRLAALWPLWIGLGTLARLRDAEDPLNPNEPVKIPRGELYRLLTESTAVVASDTLLQRAHARRRAAAA